MLRPRALPGKPGAVRFGLTLFGITTGFAIIAKFRALTGLPHAQADPFHVLRIAVGSVANSLGEMSVAALVAALAILTLSFITRSCTILLVKGLFVILTAAQAIINIASAEILPLFGTSLTVGLIAFSDVLGSEHGRLEIANWISPGGWAATIGGITMAASVAIGLRIADRRQLAAPLIVCLFTLALIAGPILPLLKYETPAYQRSPTVRFLISLRKLRDEAVLDQAEPREPAPTGPPEPGLPLERARMAGIRNVLIFVVESASAQYVGAYGAPYGATPRIDALARQSVTMESAYSQDVSTTLTKGVLFASRYPRPSIFRRPIPGPYLADQFRKAGWRTAYFDSSDIRYGDADKWINGAGFNLIQDFRGRRCSSPGIEDASEFNSQGNLDACTFASLHHWLDEDRNAPFFAMVWTFQSHWPYFVNSQAYKPDLSGDQRLDDYARLAKIRYLQALHEGDRLIGATVDHLKTNGRLDDTLIIITGDHGEAFRQHGSLGHGGELYEEAVHVPLIFANPRLPNGLRVPQPVGHIDLPPTLTDMFGLPTPPQWQGRSLLRKRAQAPVWFMSPWIDIATGYRFGNRKVIGTLLDEKAMIFDLASDPGETRNLVSGDPAEQDRLLRQLRTWTRSAAKGSK